MNKFQKLTNEELKSLKGGRHVAKFDLDGDGKWDVKCVYTSGGREKWVYR